MKAILPDLLAPGLSLLFCGTAASTTSAREQAYYAKPGNKFWPTLHTVGITPRRFLPQEFRELLALGIGFTDLCKTHYGTDAQLPDDAFDVAALKKKIKQFAPKIVAFTSKRAAETFFSTPQVYGWHTSTQVRLIAQPVPPPATRFFVLPSPSGLATRYFDISYWQQLSAALR